MSHAAAENDADAPFWIASPPGDSSSPCVQVERQIRGPCAWGKHAVNSPGPPSIAAQPLGHGGSLLELLRCRFVWALCSLGLSRTRLSCPAAAAQYYANQVGGEAAAESAAIGAVFFDESDLSYCGFWSKPALGCGALSTEDVTAQHAAAMTVLANMTKILNSAGVIPIFSLDNRIATSGNGTSAKAPCALPEDDLIAALNGTTWARFYEDFPNSYFSQWSAT